MAAFKFTPGVGYYYIQRPDGLYFTRTQKWTKDKLQAFCFIGSPDPKAGSSDALSIIKKLGLKRSALISA